MKTVCSWLATGTSPSNWQARRSEIGVLARMAATAARLACVLTDFPHDDLQVLFVQDSNLEPRDYELL